MNQVDTEHVLKSLDARFEEWLKNHGDLWTKLIFESRKFYDSVLALSVAIVGIIIPITLNSSSEINRPTLLLSALIFLVEILVGIFGRFFVIRRDIKTWPDELRKMEAGYKASKAIIRDEGVNDNSLAKIEKIFSTEKRPIFDIFKWIFMPLFAVSLILLISSFIFHGSKTHRLNKSYSDYSRSVEFR